MSITQREETLKLPAFRLGTGATGEEEVDTKVQIFHLKNASGYEAIVTTYGAMLLAFRAPTKGDAQKAENITLGLDEVKDYFKGITGSNYFGASIGRVANRIKEGKFVLEGKQYELPSINNGPNHLHGGVVGFNKHIWKAETFESGGERGVRFSRTSPNGEEGYPGNLEVQAIYCLKDDNSLIFDFKATTDALTPVNLTNHAFWNLHGVSGGIRVKKILDHELTLNADKFLPVDDNLIPTGEQRSVIGTPMDFVSQPHTIGERIADVKPKGYDHCYVLIKNGETLSVEIQGQPREKLTLAAVVVDRDSQRKMEVWTDQPGVQLYTGNFLVEVQGGEGSTYDVHTAFCLETQGFPNAVNEASFPSVLLRPGQTYTHTTVHRFSFV